MHSGIWSTSLINLLTLQTKDIPKTSPMLVLSPPTRSHIYQEVKRDSSHPLALLRYLCSIRMQSSSARHLSPYPASRGPSRPLTLSSTHSACFCEETFIARIHGHRGSSSTQLWGEFQEKACGTAGCRCPTSSWGWPSCRKPSASHTTIEKQLVRALGRV